MDIPESFDYFTEVNCWDAEGRAPLVESVRSSTSLRTLAKLLDYPETMPNFKDVSGKEALETAAQHHNLVAVKLVLKK